VEEHVFDLLPAYALGCLDREEDLRVAEHLATCGMCRGELESYRSLVAELPFAIAESDPPPGLKEVILERAHKAKGIEPAAPKTSWWQRLPWIGAAPAWSMVSLVLILVLGASNLLLWGRLSTLESRQQASLKTILLQGTESAPNATGLLVISLDGSHGTIVVDRLPVLSESQQYQLWLIRDGKRTSGGVFSVDDKGYKGMYIKSPEPLDSYMSFGITVEPAGGSPGPTGEKVLGGEL
jgi:anti-sigma-K factor RskA